MTCDSQVLPLADPPLPATCKMSPGYQTRAGRKGSSHILPGAGSAYAAVLKRKSGRVTKLSWVTNRVEPIKIFQAAA